MAQSHAKQATAGSRTMPIRGSIRKQAESAGRKQLRKALAAIESQVAQQGNVRVLVGSLPLSHRIAYAMSQLSWSRWPRWYSEKRPRIAEAQEIAELALKDVDNTTFKAFADVMIANAV